MENHHQVPSSGDRPSFTDLSPLAHDRAGPTVLVMKLRASEVCELALLGGVAGMRSALAPAVVAAQLRRRGWRAGGPVGRYLKSARVSRQLKRAAWGELFTDKLPFTPNRVKPAPLVGRILAGALAAAGWTRARKPRDRAQAALIGGGAALLSSVATFYLRRWATGRRPLANVVAGLVEDAAAMALATAATAR